MADLGASRVQNRRRRDGRPEQHRAVVVRAPTVLGESLAVRLFSEPREMRHDVEDWAPNGTVLPAVGDIALATGDDQGRLWVSGWVPSQIDPGTPGPPGPPGPPGATGDGIELGALQAFVIAPSTKWALADGTAVTVASGHTALRTALINAGNPFGVSGSDPRLPDLRGRTVIGTGQGTGLTSRAAGAQVGAETHTLTSAQSGRPAATVSLPGPSQGQALNGSGSLYSFYLPPWTAGAGGSLTVPAVDASASHPIMQPSLAVAVYVRVLP